MGDFQQERALIKNRVRRRGIYLLPNLFTTASLFAGFYAIVQAINGRFAHAAIAIFVAMVLDSLDGRVARLTRRKRVRRRQPVRHGSSAPRRRHRLRMAARHGQAGMDRGLRCAGAAFARALLMLEVAGKRYFPGLAQPGCGGAGRRLCLDRRRQCDRSDVLGRLGGYRLPA
jgi:CDP-diacylglycerol--serine O-phosphatidyltransferase